MPFCPECGASIDKKDKFCRNCGKQFEPAKESKPASTRELAKIAGMQEKIKEHGSTSNAIMLTGAVLSFAICITLMISLQFIQPYWYYGLIFILIFSPFAVVGFILVYYKDKLQRKLEKGELT